MPRDVVVKWVGTESGFVGLIVATLAGIIVPGGPITVFPVAAAFLAVGASVGAIVAFVTSWTLPLPVVAGLLAQWLAGWLGARTGGGNA